MNSIIYTNLGGLPVTEDHMSFLQNSFSGPLAAIASLFGDKVIVTGVVNTGGAVSNGYVVINGELLPFIGGAVGTEVTIVETRTKELFNDGNNKDVYIDRYATFGTPGLNFSDFVPLSTLKDLQTAVFRPGMVLMWSGNPANVPAGFGLCDGGGGRPDLSKMFIVGYDPTDPDYDTIGKTGGEKQHTLTPLEMPEHDHPQGGANDGGSSPGVVLDFNNLSGTYPILTQRTGKTGGGQPHENRPPYYVLAYIIKL